MTNASKTRILIDTDPGIDDATAILLALASPEIQLEAITTTQGNVPVETCTRNALALLELAGAAHIPVAQGSRLPLLQPILPETAHGHDGLGGAVLPEPQRRAVPQHAVDFLIDRVLAEPGELTVFAIGPLSNIAIAIRKEPKFAGALKAMVIMGGAIREPGNTTPLAEFNIYNDPHAAHIVFHSGIPITLIPLDVTHKNQITRRDMESIGLARCPVARLLHEAFESYRVYYEDFSTFRGPPLHDPLTLATILSPDVLALEELYVDVDIQGGVSMGNTFADFYRLMKQPPNMQVALDLRGREFMDLFVERMIDLCRDRAG